MIVLKINVTDIQREIGYSQEVRGEIAFEDILWQGEPLRFKGPMHIEGKITNGGEMLVLEAVVRGTVILMCGLCMESFEHTLDFPFEARLKKTSEEENPDYFLYQGYEIDISDIVMEFLLLEIPSRRRCREDCKGLCPECGQDLNANACQCTTKEENDPDEGFDERLKALKDYFSHPR